MSNRLHILGVRFVSTQTLSIDWNLPKQITPYSQWCHPGPGRREDLSDETPPPSARAPIGCWDPHWSRRYSESVWRGLRTCGHEGGIIGRAGTGEGVERNACTHIHNPPDITHPRSLALQLLQGFWSVKLMQATEEKRVLHNTLVSLASVSFKETFSSCVGGTRRSRGRAVCSLPECAEGLIVVDVSWTQGSYHRSARIPPWRNTKKKNTSDCCDRADQ